MHGLKTSVITLTALVALMSAVSSYAVGYATSCKTEGFSCVRVKRGQSWQSLFPEERERGIVMRLNHRNGELYPGLKLIVPDDIKDHDLMDYTPMPPRIEAQGEKVIYVDLGNHIWAAYDADGYQVRWGPATGGRKHCPPPNEDSKCNTKEGSYRIYSLGSSNCVSTKFPEPDGGAPMPYCMFFDGGQALHGSPGGIVDANVSHGCVRMFVQDAEWMRYDFAEPAMTSNNYRGTKVVVLTAEKFNPNKTQDLTQPVEHTDDADGYDDGEGDSLY